VGLAVYHYRVPETLALSDLAVQISERSGLRCEIDERTIRCRALLLALEYERTGDRLEVAAMMPTTPYFMLQLELSVVDLGGRRLRAFTDELEATPSEHPLAGLRWRQVPLGARLAQGAVGKLGLGVGTVVVHTVALVTAPIWIPVTILVAWARRDARG